MTMRPLPHAVSSRFAQPDFLLDEAALPARLDYRDQGAVTPPKDQRSCGGCWAFAAAGCVESACILAGASSSINLSEQWPLSCDRDLVMGVQNDGCCGGAATVFEFLKNDGVVAEAGFPYGEGDFGDPRRCGGSWAFVPCPPSPPDLSNWIVDAWGLVVSGRLPTPGELKAALILHGPIWLGYEVHDDFVNYWMHADPGTVYTHTSGAWIGWHAVLVIGYDDAGQYWIVKNSWGNTGPEGDGTFLIAYNSNCSFGTDASWVAVRSFDVPSKCCLAGGECQVLPQTECEAAGGTFSAGDDCAPNDCPVVWACCSANTCVMTTEAACDDGGAPPWKTWFPGEQCGGINCATPVERVTWGGLKNIYR
jgi:hypothetical protein